MAPMIPGARDNLGPSGAAVGRLTGPPTGTIYFRGGVRLALVGVALAVLARIGLGPRTAYTGLFAITVLFAVLFGRLVQREAAIFLGKWPQHEARITKAINSLPTPEQWLSHTFNHGHQSQGRTGAGEAVPNVADIAESPPPDTSLGDLFTRFARVVIDYVLQLTLDVAETFVLVLVYLVFLFVGSRKLPDRIRKAFPGGRGERILLLIGEGVSQSMERFMAVKTVVGLGMAICAGLLMLLFGVDHWLLSIDFVEVRMSGKELNLDPTLMFLWLAYWGWVWGASACCSPTRCWLQ